MMTNGQLTNRLIELNDTMKLPPQTGKLLAYAQIVLSVIIAITLGYGIFVTVPALQRVEATIRIDRAGEADRANMIDAAIKRQITNQALLLMQQEQSIERARELNRSLKRND